MRDIKYECLRRAPDARPFTLVRSQHRPTSRRTRRTVRFCFMPSKVGYLGKLGQTRPALARASAECPRGQQASGVNGGGGGKRADAVMRMNALNPKTLCERVHGVRAIMS